MSASGSMAFFTQWRPRAAEWIGFGACGGVVFGTLVVWCYSLSKPTPVPSSAEILFLKLLGSIPELTFRPAFVLKIHKGYRWFAIPAALLIWQRARPIVLACLAGCLSLFAAWVAAVACATAYALDHDLGRWPAVLALAPALLMATWRRWQMGTSLALMTGVALGTLVAQGLCAFPFQDQQSHFRSPAIGFWPPVVAGAVIGGLLLLRRPPEGTERRTVRVARLWALTTAVIASATFVSAELRALEPRPPDPPGSRVLESWAYDVHVIGARPALVWTDRKRIHVLDDVYGAPGAPYTIDSDDSYYAERIWATATDGFRIETDDQIVEWATPEPGHRVSDPPARRHREPPWLRGDSSTVWTVAEDPRRGHLFTVSEYYSHYAVLDRDSGDSIAIGTLSGSIWPWWYFDAVPERRVLYVTSALDDGALYEMDLDSLSIREKAANLYMYETAFDAGRGLLWGTRPLTGEVVGADVATGELSARVPLEFGVRDLQRDGQTGDLYTCAFLSGDVYRIGGRDLKATRIARCGRLCRNMDLDAPRGTLWVATRDGVCRVSLPRADARR